MTTPTSASTSTPPAAGFTRGSLVRLSIALVFLVACGIYTYIGYGTISITLVVAAVFGAYMAMNIGANDVANNVGPAVGARAMTLGVAILIAAIFEAMGAIIAGGEVVTTIKGGIIDPGRIAEPMAFVWVMMAALLAGAVWLHFATVMGAPVSTTHSIVGGVLGAGVAAAGWSVVNWPTLGNIVLSWIVSPLCGGLIAAGLLYAVKRTITYQNDVMGAARRTVPILLGLMAWAFTTYLVLKGLQQVVEIGVAMAVLIGAGVGIGTFFYTRIRVAQRSTRLSNDRDGVNQLFTIPLMFAAALMSFAHGSNDVANAIGPLAAIYDTLTSTAIQTRAEVPLWILVMGALGLSIGLALYGPRLIHTVGSEITDIDATRAYCIAVSTAATVIIASQLGLPISSTHVAIGAVFGVGFLREYLKARYERIIREIKQHHREQEAGHETVVAFLAEFEGASIADKGRMLKALKRASKLGQIDISKQERKGLRKVHRENLVRRSVMRRVVAAWIVTVPASAVMAAVTYFAIRGAMLP